MQGPSFFFPVPWTKRSEGLPWVSLICLFSISLQTRDHTDLSHFGAEPGPHKKWNCESGQADRECSILWSSCCCCCQQISVSDYKCCLFSQFCCASDNLYRAFSLTWPAFVQICWNERKRLHKKRVQFPENWFRTPTWLLFHCFGTPMWSPRLHVKTLFSDLCLVTVADLLP